MTTTPVIMPQMGESIAEGTIVTWFKKPGERVEKDEPLFEISTDKVDAEIPSPASGFLSATLFGPGQTVEVNKVVAHITSEQGGVAPATAEPVTEILAPVPALAQARSEGPSVEELRRIRSSPLVRRLAQENGLDLRQLTGSGQSGRVTKQDILTHIEAKPAPVAAALPVAPGKFAYQPQSSDRAEPVSPMRSAIAEHMVISRETSVHVTTVFEVDMTRVARLRQHHKPAYAERGVNLTFTPFIMHALVKALGEFPILNASLVDRTLYYKKNIHLGMAVALDWGLLVPVIKRADDLSLLGLARAANDLAERARSKKLAPDEVQGGTFTITNPGVFGSLFGTPIINQPQVAILGVGTITKRVVVIEDDAIAIRSMVHLMLSFDHRVIDGATADKFMSRIKHELQNFSEQNL
jgi:pyruvate dehydrogenase E2 component (dihydrolipoamide acetyltransferase)